MTSSSEKIDLVTRRLNSFMNEIMEGTKGVGDTQSHNVEYYGLKRFLEFYKQVKEMFPENDLLPTPLSMEEINKKYQYGSGFYLKATIREIADALGITLKYDKKSESGPIMAQYQNQNVSQINFQNIDNVIECVNNLQIELNKKEEIINLVREFDQAAEKKDSSKLKSILKKVAELSPKAATFLLEHASELGLMSLLLGS